MAGALMDLKALVNLYSTNDESPYFHLIRSLSNQQRARLLLCLLFKQTLFWTVLIIDNQLINCLFLSLTNLIIKLFYKLANKVY